ncbi:MAG: hypothetical protein OEM91_05925 [Hyphomicrobiales bacterium]|nr:hypothetical protein [Hyphomicrobiales bacterium]
MASHSATAPVGLIPGTPGAHKAGLIARVVSSIAGFLDSLAASQAAVHHYEYLTRLSDGELAVHGLKREDISRHVFEQAFGRR